MVPCVQYTLTVTDHMEPPRNGEREQLGNLTIKGAFRRELARALQTHAARPGAIQTGRTEADI